MAITLTDTALNALESQVKEPAVVLEFDGIDTRIGSATVGRFARIGDEGLLIGDDWKIGGSSAYGDQLKAISFDAAFGSTTTKLDFKLNPDRGIGSSVSSMTVAMVDFQDNSILQLFADNEMLGRKAKIYLTPNADKTQFPDDYITIFRGIIDNIELSPGGVVINISHPDQKKRQTIFNSVETALNGAIDNSTTTIVLDETTNLLTPVNGPDGSNDTSLKFYVRIDDEIIRYTGWSGSTLTGVTRAQLGTTAAAHDDEASVTSFYTLDGNAMDLALKLMLSGMNGYFKTGVSYATVDGSQNAYFVNTTDVEEVYGLVPGDYITASGSDVGANNITLELIEEVIRTDEGSYIVVDSGVTLTTDNDPPTGVVLAFRSKYDTLGEGLKMSPDEVDVAHHEFLKDIFLSSYNYQFYLKETISSGKEFIENQIYSPVACFSVPRNARASVGYHIGPLPTTEVKILDTSNVKNASRIVKKRSLGRNFYNTIIYKFDDDTLTDKYLQGAIYTNATSKTQIPVGNRALIIETGGLRDGSIVSTNAQRRLDRYAFAAEYLPQVRVTFKEGFSIDVGDLVIFDGSELKVGDFETGTRDSAAKLYEVMSKSLDFKSGDISLELVSTNYATQNRYGLIAPASFVKTGTSTTVFVIEDSFESIYGANEYRKWERFLPNLYIKVRSESYATNSGAKLVTSIVGNTITVASSLGFTPSAGMIMEFADYASTSESVKLIYQSIAEDDTGFSNGDEPYRMI